MTIHSAELALIGMNSHEFKAVYLQISLLYLLVNRLLGNELTIDEWAEFRPSELVPLKKGAYHKYMLGYLNTYGSISSDVNSTCSSVGGDIE